ncbi:uncharacterized protein [Pagrus major]|uniref:uncharacterized protein n=1 Tax=Pagrus major TaxID=143350 RepID=UPI003CC88243
MPPLTPEDHELSSLKSELRSIATLLNRVYAYPYKPLNVTKTKELVVNLSRTKVPLTPVSIQGVSVDIVEYLGVHTDNKLDWWFAETYTPVFYSGDRLAALGEQEVDNRRDLAQQQRPAERPAAERPAERPAAETGSRDRQQRDQQRDQQQRDQQQRDRQQRPAAERPAAERPAAETGSRETGSRETGSRDRQQRPAAERPAAESSSSVMSVLKSSPLTVLLTCSWIIVACGDTQVKVKQPGYNATLQCRAHRDGSIEKLAWNKTDLKSDKYVFFFRENRSYENYQLLSFRGRVKLRDRQMKEGDASVVLKNVTANDSGPYECSVFMSGGGGGGGGHTERATFRHIVHLKVEDSGPKAGGSEERGSEEGGSEEGGSKEGGNLHGYYGLMVLIGLIAVAVLGLIGFLVYKRLMKKNSEQPAADEKQHLSTESVEVLCQSEV